MRSQRSVPSKKVSITIAPLWTRARPTLHISLCHSFLIILPRAPWVQCRSLFREVGSYSYSTSIPGWFSSYWTSSRFWASTSKFSTPTCSWILTIYYNYLQTKRPVHYFSSTCFDRHEVVRQPSVCSHHSMRAVKCHRSQWSHLST